ncbi:response regulator [Spongiivirga sp. MCCC 1A20706]|uniref:response regulator n=1 Tax=Spongiivirga sp. MCCC 1A20706 TaxID=3160963 RepID=UPI0039775BB8
MPSLSYESPLDILVVDDNPIDRMINSRVIQKVHQDSLIDFAEDGSEALICLQKRNYDVVLLDIKMPIMDGFQFMEQLKDEKDPDEVYIIMVTSSVDPEDKKKASMYEHIKDYVEKPLKEESLTTHEFLPSDH